MKNSIYIGTNNQLKYKKICRLLSLINEDIVCIPLPANIPDAKENGIDEQENAVIKAEYYFKKIKKTVLAEDTGIYLNNFPKKILLGPHTHRSIRKIASNHGNNNKEIQFFWNQLIINNNITDGSLKHAFCIKTENETFKVFISVKLKVIPSYDDNYDRSNLNSHLIPLGFTCTYQDMSDKIRKEYYQKYFLSKLKIINEKIT